MVDEGGASFAESFADEEGFERSLVVVGVVLIKACDPLVDCL